MCPVRAEGDTADGALVAVQGLAELVWRACVPEPHRPVVAGGGERVPVRAEGDAADGALCGRVRGWPSCSWRARVPEPHRPVVAGGGERVPVRAEGDAVDGACVAGQGLAELFVACARPRAAPSRPRRRRRACVPSGLKATPADGSLGGRSGVGRAVCGVRASQSRTVPSSPAEASVCPSGLKATPVTESCVAASGVGRAVCGLRASQSRTVPSSPAEASVCPSGLKATPWTGLGGHAGSPPPRNAEPLERRDHAAPRLDSSGSRYASRLRSSDTSKSPGSCRSRRMRGRLRLPWQLRLCRVALLVGIGDREGAAHAHAAMSNATSVATAARTRRLVRRCCSRSSPTSSSISLPWIGAARRRPRRGTPVAELDVGLPARRAESRSSAPTRTLSRATEATPSSAPSRNRRQPRPELISPSVFAMRNLPYLLVVAPVAHLLPDP